MQTGEGAVGGLEAAQLRAEIDHLSATMAAGVLANQVAAGTVAAPADDDAATALSAGGPAARRTAAKASISSGGGAAAGTPSGSATTVYVPAAIRLQALQDTSSRARDLLAELERIEVPDPNTGKSSNGKDKAKKASGGGAASQPQCRVPLPGRDVATGALMTVPLVALRAWNGQKKFSELCDLVVKPSSSSSPSASVVTMTPAYQRRFLLAGSTAAQESDSPSPTAVDDEEDAAADKKLRLAALQPLGKMRDAFTELEKCKGFAYQQEIEQLAAEARAAATAKAAAERADGGGSATGAPAITAPPPPSTSHKIKYMPAVVQRMSEALAVFHRNWLYSGEAKAAGGGPDNNNNKKNPTSQNGDDDGGSAIGSSAMPSLVSSEHAKALLTHVAAWPHPLLRLLNDVLQSPTLETVTESTRERLRRAIFDVEELAHEQEQAVTDGDMQKSEELYFQQTEMQESLKPIFDSLENLMESYKTEKVGKPRDQLRSIQKQFTSAYQETLRKEEKEQRRVQEDMKRLQERRRVIRQVRSQQSAGLALYTSEWQKHYDNNTRQQEECLRAMAQLEARLTELAQEQTFLIHDRVEKLGEERQRRDAAEAFLYYTEAQSAGLASTEKELASLVDGLRQVGSAVEFTCSHLDSYLRDVVQEHVAQALLETRKQRLEQFRSLYLTLGDLNYKKCRHADEIAKKVEYYALQQEIAMDALNPKAKEYSQARKKWEMVQAEVNSQLHSLDARTEQQLEDFKPTEQLLIEAGVKFVHPADELQRRNEVRQQKLLEYQQLMGGASSGAAGSGADATGASSPVSMFAGGGGSSGSGGTRSAEDILAEDMRMFARHAPRLQSTEEQNYSNSGRSR